MRHLPRAGARLHRRHGRAPLASTGEVHPRGAMSLTNVAYSPVSTWANPTAAAARAAGAGADVREHPVELGWRIGARTAATLRAEPTYQTLFRRRSLATRVRSPWRTSPRRSPSFERTLISGSSPYDRYRTRFEIDAISPAAHRGEDLFFNERAGCFHCHGGFNFTQAVDYVGKAGARGRVPQHRPVQHRRQGRLPGDQYGVYEISGRPR